MLWREQILRGRRDGESIEYLLSTFINRNFRAKDMKIGEGMYAVVYRGTRFVVYQRSILTIFSGREASTGRQVAIKKIKVGQFKDGLDMSAIREVKFLRELKHQNVIEVRPFKWLKLYAESHRLLALRRIFFKNEPQFGTRVS